MKEKRKSLRVIAVVLLAAVLTGWFPTVEARADVEPYLSHYSTFEGWYIRDNAPSKDRDWRFDLKFTYDATYGSEGDIIGYGRVIAQKYVWDEDTWNNDTKFLYYEQGEIRRVAYNVFKLYLPNHKYVKFKVTDGEAAYHKIKITKTNIKVKKMGKVKTPKGSYTRGNNWYTDDWNFW